MSTISIVVAAATNNVIGKGNALPWHLPADLKRFKSITIGHPIIMGRKTFESIGRPLPGRENIVITRQCAWASEGVKVVNSLDDAIQIANGIIESKQVTEIMVVGGAEIYRQALPICQKIYLTEVQAEMFGDTYFPRLSDKEWRETYRDGQHDIKGNSHKFSFVVKERVSGQN